MKLYQIKIYIICGGANTFGGGAKCLCGGGGGANNFWGGCPPQKICACPEKYMHLIGR
jgi:hypothetical protein